MNFIDYVGISSYLPVDIKYFKEELFDTLIFKKKDGKDINRIISVSVICKSNSIKLVNTKASTSNEGQTLTGKKILIELSVDYRVKYTSNSMEKYIYILKNSSTKIMHIVVPSHLNDTQIEELIRRKKILIEPIVEDIYACNRDNDSIYIRTLLLLNATIKI